MALKEQRQQARGLVGRAKTRVARLRERWPLLDHVVRAVQHYSDVKGSVLAGAVTYFGFLSLFPILALAFAAVGWVANIYPDAEEDLVTAIETVLPGLIGDEEGMISIDAFKSAAGTVGLIGLIGLLYAGLGWLSAMRQSLTEAFELPSEEERNFVVGKSVDLAVLVVIGVTMIVSVAVSGVITGFSTSLFSWIGMEGSRLAQGVLWALSLVVGVGVGVLLFYVIYRVLAVPHIPRRSLVGGAVVAALLFEVLKRAAFLIIPRLTSTSAFAVLGVSLVLLIWLNYTSRVIVLGAAWAQTSPAAMTELEARALQQRRDIEYVPVAGARPLAQARREARRQRLVDRVSLASGVVIGVVVGATATLLRRRP
jgi:membrane protein